MLVVKVLYAFLFLCILVDASTNLTDGLLSQFRSFKSEVKHILLMTSYNQGRTHEKLDRLIGPGVYSKFEHQHKILSRLEALESFVKKQEKENRQLKRILGETGNSFSKGAVYVRWGRHDCPANGTEFVYKGYVGGSWSTHTGGSVNYECLPEKPLWDKYDDIQKSVNQNMHGAEYSINTVNIKGTALDQSLNGHDVPCVVCRSKVRSSVLRIPARNHCYDGWHLEYSGYLMSGKLSHGAASEYACMDRHPQKLHGGAQTKGGKLFGPVEGHCHYSLRCPPYVHGRELTCAVCTK